MADADRVSIQIRREDHADAYTDLREAVAAERGVDPDDLTHPEIVATVAREYADLAALRRDKRVADAVDHIAEDHDTDPEAVTLACAMKVTCGAYNGYQMTDDRFE